MNRLNQTAYGVLAGLTVAITGIPTLVIADDFTVEEVVVTARQRSELLQDVPASITAFTASDIESAGIVRAEDFISLTPGVSMVDAAEVGDTQISIRGINGARDGEANFAFIIDGILMTNPSAFNREFSDLQQIEVLKGPQGAVYGRSASAGAIIVTTKKPGNEFETDFTASGAYLGDDSHASGFASGMASGALIKDELFGRFSFDYRKSDGFYDNDFLDSPSVDDFEGFNLNGRLLWEPSDRTSVDTRFRYGEVDAAAISFNASFQLDVTGFGNFSAFGVPFREDVDDHAFSFVSNIDPQNDQESKEFSIKVDHDMDWAIATGWFLYSDIQQEFIADGTAAAAYDAAGALAPDCVSTSGLKNFLNLAFGSSTCDGYQFQVRNQEDFSVDFRLTSPGEDRLRWQAGLYYLHLEREVGVATGIDNTFSGVALPDQLLVSGVTETLYHDDFITDVYAVYGSLNYDVTPDIEAAVALRYDLEDREADNLVPTDVTNTIIDTNGDGVTGSDFLNPGITSTAGIADREASFDQIQPKFTLTWDTTDNLTTFASWGVGFKSGGFNNAGSAATVANAFGDILLDGVSQVTVSDKFEKEVSQSVEVGFKSQFGRFKLDGAAYHTTVDDMQFFEFFVGDFGLLRLVNTIDEATINGFELATSVALSNELSIFANYGLVNGSIDENKSRPYTVGNDIPYAPEYTANLGFDLNTPLWNNVNLLWRVDWSLVGETWFHTVQDETVSTSGFFGPANYSTSERDSYNTLNMRVGLEGSHWTLIGFANNLADTDYLEEVIPAIEFGGSFVHPGNKRALGLELNVQF